MLQKIAYFENKDNNLNVVIENIESEMLYILNYDTKKFDIIKGINYLDDLLELLENNAININTLKPFKEWLECLDDDTREDCYNYFKNDIVKELFKS